MMHPRHGFTLVEIAIVLLIIGLIVGGIFVGQDLYRASQINSVAVDLQRFHTAIDGFKIKYRTLPGDMTDATHYWGRADGGSDTTQNCASPSTNAGTGYTTCNGNGDGYIGAYEGFRVWQHLTAASLIPNPLSGYYTGVSGAYGYTLNGVGDWRPGTNIPVSRIKGVGYGMMYIGTIPTSDTGVYFAGKYNNAILVGGLSAGYEARGLVFTPAEAQNLDTKIDDGKAGLGSIVPRNANYASCSNGTAATSTTATYRLDVTSAQCFLYYRRATD